MIAQNLSKRLGVPADFIIMGNGAIELIQTVVHNFVQKKVLINLPTFSSYYEFAKDRVEVLYNNLNKYDNFELNIEQFINLAKVEKPDTIVLINPNNPTGGYTVSADICRLINELKEVENLIIDESFISFSYEDSSFSSTSAQGLIESCKNLIIIKSMSKDFGIAGIRCGYALMNPEKVQYLLKNGFLWNLSGLAEYFIELYSQDLFYGDYEDIRIKYVKETQEFSASLSSIKQIKVYPSRASFALVELVDGTTSMDFCSKLLLKHGVYTRTCVDKIGLDGEFVRIAAKNQIDNRIIMDSIKDIF